MDNKDRHGPQTIAQHDINDKHDHSHVPGIPQHVAKNAIPLSELPVGTWCTVFQVGGEGSLRRRLLDMGVTPKIPLFKRKVAPLGDPMEIHLRGYDLSLRKEDACRILVVPNEGGAQK